MALRKRGVGVDIDLSQREGAGAAEPPEAREGLLAEVAALARVDDDLGQGAAGHDRLAPPDDRDLGCAGVGDSRVLDAGQ